MITPQRIIQLLLLIAIVIEVFVLADSRSAPPAPKRADQNREKIDDHAVFSTDYSRLDDISNQQLLELLENAKQQPGSGAVWFELADALLVHGFLPESIACSETAEQNGTKTGQAYFWHGVALHQMGMLEASNEAFLLATEQLGDPQMLQFAHYGLARNALRQEDPQAAERALQKCLPFELGRFELARLLIRLDRFDAAIKHLKILLEHEPDAHRVLQLLARVAEQQEDLAEALRLRDRADRGRDVFPADGLIYLLREKAGKFGIKYVTSISKQYTESGQLSDAISVQKKILAAQWDAVVAFQTILNLLKTNQLEDARQLADEMLHREGASPSTCAILGDIYAQQGDAEQAREFRLRSIELQASWQALERLANDQFFSLEQRQQYRQQMYLWKGESQLLERNAMSALESFESAIELNPKLVRAWYGCGEALRLTADYEKAGEAYAKCLELDSEYDPAQRRLEQLPIFSGEELR